MRRNNAITIRLTDREAAILQLAANKTNPTPTGGNTAAAVRAVALKSAIWHLAPCWSSLRIAPGEVGLQWWDAATDDPERPAAVSQLQTVDRVILSPAALLDFILWAATLPGWDTGPIQIEPAPNLGSLPALLQAMIDDDPRVSDWTELPTYGGRPPATLDGVWSWDRESVIVGTCGDDLEIIPRGEL